MHRLRNHFRASLIIVLLAALSVRAEDSGPAPAAPSPHGASSGLLPKPGAPDIQPFTLQARFFDAASTGNVESVKKCLDKGVDARAKDEVGRSAVALAVRDAKSLEIVEILFARGVAIDDPDAVGRTPLHEAAGNGSASIVKWLLEHGAKADRKDTQGRTPLHSAVMGGSHEDAALLLASNADVNARDNFADTPLMVACNKGNDEIARLLVEKGADPLLKDQEGRTASARSADTSKYCLELPGDKPAPPPLAKPDEQQAPE